MRPESLAALLGLLAITAYAVLAGADFGGGVWDLFATGPRRTEQRAAVGLAMGPVWETNHVWLIYVVVLLFTCFPPVFAKLSEVLYGPLTLGLLGIVLRGAAFAFRGPATRELFAHRAWGVLFGVASVAAPFLLGASAAAIATGSFDPWRPMPLCVGLFAVTLCAQVAAIFLVVETTGSLREDFRRRALWSSLAVALAGAAALAAARASEPLLVAHLVVGAPLAIVASAMLLGIGACASLFVGRVYLARVAVVLEIVAVLGGWYVAQAPYVTGQLGIASPAAPPATIQAFLWTSLAGAIMLVPSLALLFSVFKREKLGV